MGQEGSGPSSSHEPWLPPLVCQNCDNPRPLFECATCDEPLCEQHAIWLVAATLTPLCLGCYNENLEPGGQIIAGYRRLRGLTEEDLLHTCLDTCHLTAFGQETRRGMMPYQVLLIGLGPTRSFTVTSAMTENQLLQLIEETLVRTYRSHTFVVRHYGRVLGAPRTLGDMDVQSGDVLHLDFTVDAGRLAGEQALTDGR
jgi:hypothetical protein